MLGSAVRHVENVTAPCDPDARHVACGGMCSSNLCHSPSSDVRVCVPGHPRFCRARCLHQDLDCLRARASLRSGSQIKALVEPAYYSYAVRS
eukprot:6196899-Pleurochrysis_carterae.AAC.1